MKMKNIYRDVLEKLDQSMNPICMTLLIIGSEDLKIHTVFILPTPSWRGWEAVSSWGPGWGAVA